MGGTKIGIGFGLWGLGLPSPDTICDYAERAEDQGIDSIWLSDHIVARNPSFDTACIMAMWAGRTKRIKMGPSVLTMPAPRSCSGCQNLCHPGLSVRQLQPGHYGGRPGE